MSTPNGRESGPPVFPATRESLVAAIGAVEPAVRRDAFDRVVASYWRPVYKYLRVIRRVEHDDAEDLTQDFFAHALAKESLAGYDPTKARFRTFLRVCLDRFALNEVKSRQRQKRGGHLQRLSLDGAALEPALAADLVAAHDPESYFRREWIRAVFEHALHRLEVELADQPTPLALFLAADVEPGESGGPSYRDLADRFGLSTSQVTNQLAQARRAFRRAALTELRALSGSEAEFRAEARELFGIDSP